MNDLGLVQFVCSGLFDQVCLFGFVQVCLFRFVCSGFLFRLCMAVCMSLSVGHVWQLGCE